MSVKIMGLVWDLDNSVIDREEKYVLLAYTDHADHEGNNIFPSIALICQKTGYKERAAQMITRSLVAKRFLVNDGKGPKGTNKWKYGGGAEIAGVQNSPDGGAKSTGEGVQRDAPEPLRTTPLEPSKGATPKQPKANGFPELVLYREVTEKYPAKASWHTVVKFTFEISKRLGRQPTKDDLLPFYEAWCNRGWLATSVNWMEYAVRGELPTAKNGNGKHFSPPPIPISDEEITRLRAQMDAELGVR